MAKAFLIAGAFVLSAQAAAADRTNSTSISNLPTPPAQETFWLPFTNSLIRNSMPELPASAITRPPSGSPLTNHAVQPSLQREHESRFQTQLETARQQRRDRNIRTATKLFLRLLNSDAPDQVKRTACLELAVLQDEENQWAKALQFYGQFMHRFPQDPRTPEILLRQGLLYRKMGAPKLALDKYHSVLSSALSFGLERLEYYQQLVLLAQTEIAETYFAEKKFEEALTYLNRLLKLDHPDLNRPQVHYKHIHGLNALGRMAEVIEQAQDFLIRFPPDLAEYPEVRFLLVGALRKSGRDQEALEQVRLLLDSQQVKASSQPANWAYWQRRAGQEFAQYCFDKGAWANALMIYLGLAQLDQSASWQVPLWYQIGLVRERLQQPDEAAQIYARILERENELGSPPPPGYSSFVSMAKWRRQFLAWQTKSVSSSREFEPSPALDPAPVRSDNSK